MHNNNNNILRFARLSKATSTKEKIEDAIKSTRYLFTHIMEGVRSKIMFSLNPSLHH